MHQVIIVGSGPTGLMLAGELALAGVEAVVLERRPNQELAGSRGGGFHCRTIELLDQRGIADRFLAEGQTMQAATFGSTMLDLGGLPSRHPYTLALFQNHIERLLHSWVTELGVTIRRGVEVTGVVQDDAGVDIRLADGETQRAAYVVGADGGRSVVRTSVGIDFVGAPATRSSLIAEVAVTEEIPAAGTGRVDRRGIHGVHPMGAGTVRIVVTEDELGSATPPTLAELRRALADVFGTDFGVHDPTWLSRFTDAARQASRYRSGRVLLAGDAAHVHSPTGGLGIGLGIQDAVNLGWKLGQVVAGTAPDDLLDSYHAERHPAGARALAYTMAQSLFQRADPRQDAMKGLVDEMLADDGPREVIATLIAGLDLRYAEDGHPLLGCRMPDLDLVTADGPQRLFTLLHDARPLLLDFTSDGLDLGGWSGRVRRVASRCDGPWVLPVVGEVAAAAAVLVRPDGHVAWVGEGTDAGLVAALTTWFGPVD